MDPIRADIRLVPKRKLSANDADAAATVLAQAFAFEPLWLYLFPDATQRTTALHRSFRATIPWYLEQGIVWGMGQPLISVAIWQTPGPCLRPWWTILNRHSTRLLLSPFLFAFRRAFPIFAEFDRMHSQYVTQPHYYLSTIGTLPEAQGGGYGSRLLRPMLDKVDEQGYSAYTETMTPANVPLYEHYGFVCQEAYSVPNTDLHIWSFYRPVRSPS